MTTFYRYLASPYSHPDPAVMHQRYEEVERAAAWLIARKVWVYSPIVHCHNMARKLSLPIDAAFWQEYNHVMIDSSRGLLILMIDGWKESVGVAEEREFAKKYNKEVHHVMPREGGYELTLDLSL